MDVPLSGGSSRPLHATLGTTHARLASHTSHSFLLRVRGVTVLSFPFPGLKQCSRCLKVSCFHTRFRPFVLALSSLCEQSHDFVFKVLKVSHAHPYYTPLHNTNDSFPASSSLRGPTYVSGILNIHSTHITSRCHTFTNITRSPFTQTILFKLLLYPA